MYTFHAQFETTDDAEHAGAYLNSHIPGLTVLSVAAMQPKSIQAQRTPHQEHFTLLPTAVASQHYITALVVTEHDRAQDYTELERRETARLTYTCPSLHLEHAQRIITAMGGNNF